MNLTPDKVPDTQELPISIIIPLYNERNILIQNLEELGNFYNHLVGVSNWFFILVDNGSTDGTTELVKDAVKRWPLSSAIFLNKPNYGAALKAGLQSATSDWVYMLDIEQWDFPFMEWAWANRKNFDLFLASKRADPLLNNQPPYRRFLSTGLNGLLHLFFGFSGSDTHGPKLLNRRELNSIIQLSQLDRGQFDTELVLRSVRARKLLVEVPIEYRESRPHRNMMLKKIVWNIVALQKLYIVMKKVPYEGYARYYKYTRDEVINCTIITNVMKIRHV